jgi:hypothetical protein
VNVRVRLWLRMCGLSVLLVRRARGPGPAAPPRADGTVTESEVGAVGYGRMSFAKREMQVETSPRSVAWAMHLSNVVKTVVLRSISVPTRTANTTAMTSARMPQISPAAACPELVAPLVFPRTIAISPKTAAARPPGRARGNKTNEIAATRLATPRTSALTPRPFLGWVGDGVTGGRAVSE